MVHLLDDDRFAGVRWWALIDDDTFVFANRLARLLSHLRDDQPIAAGDGKAQMSMCGSPCNETEYKAYHNGDRPVLKGNSLATPVVISRVGMRMMRTALREKQAYLLCIKVFISA